MKTKNPISIFFSVFMVALLVSPIIVSAQSTNFSNTCTQNGYCEYIWVQLFGFDKEWLNEPRQLIINAIIPTIAIYAIFLGLLRTLRIFSGTGNVEHLISLLVSLSALFIGWVGYISYALYGLGNFAFLIFVLIFVVGTILYTKGYFIKLNATTQIFNSYKKRDKQISDRMLKLELEIEELKSQKLNDKNLTSAKLRTIDKNIIKREEELAKKQEEKIKLNHVLREVT